MYAQGSRKVAPLDLRSREILQHSLVSKPLVAVALGFNYTFTLGYFLPTPDHTEVQEAGWCFEGTALAWKELSQSYSAIGAPHTTLPFSTPLFSSKGVSLTCGFLAHACFLLCSISYGPIIWFVIQSLEDPNRSIKSQTYACCTGFFSPWRVSAFH